MIGRGEHGVDAIISAFQIIAAHAVLGLGMAKDRLDRGASFHLTSNWPGDSAHLAACADVELLFVIVAVAHG